MGIVDIIGKRTNGDLELKKIFFYTETFTS